MDFRLIEIIRNKLEERRQELLSSMSKITEFSQFEKFLDLKYSLLELNRIEEIIKKIQETETS